MDVDTVVKEGYLTKKGYFVKNWKKRYFVLTHNRIEYFLDDNKKNRRGIISIVEGGVLMKSERRNHLILLKPNGSTGRTWEIQASSEQERDEWMNSIGSVLKKSKKRINSMTPEQLKEEQKMIKEMEQEMSDNEEEEEHPNKEGEGEPSHDNEAEASEPHREDPVVLQLSDSEEES